MAQQEMKAANETYAGFLSLLKVGTIITIVVTAFVVLLIAS
ncbi:MAG: aa3-type cytochrome c oxidase subunit IV [Sphingopyxis sp.]|nr:aa3-type cytochrome c oxidase subunit IV [Sphingopyxis sp.]MDZ3831089.1 aa3-type cytochrome c oxidase subunit IV [Sphingopyxis sp.]